MLPVDTVLQMGQLLRPTVDNFKTLWCPIVALGILIEIVIIELIAGK